MVFGDNETVINTASTPDRKLHKCHNVLLYHKACKDVTTGIIRVHHIPGNTNPADILSKHWDYSSVWPMLKPLLFWQGDTAKIPKPKPSDDDDTNDTCK